QPMHIPDGFLSAAVSLFFWTLSAMVIAVALRQVNRQLGDREVPFMGVLAAAIFAGQMLNFTVIGGTSGHLLGAALAAILLGPWAAVLVMTAVVGVQALIFQDGGLLVLGANLFNMAVLGVAVASAVNHLVRRLTGKRRWGVFAGGFLAGWASIFVAALACALQLAVSGTSPVGFAVPAMAGVHALIGVGEGLITAGALAFLYTARRDLVEAGAGQAENSPVVWVGGGLLAVLLVMLAPYASAHPDGLESVAMRLGFLDRAIDSPLQLIPDYLLPGAQNEAAATVAAGLIGLLLVAGVTVWMARSRKSTSS
ncbi:MAG TPA: energy-coupling factor ABC transporter permease, partial [Anaerolineaceae bacterium]|nr:energy-coupling factor ABC transporter permease [Anaerolineaceae bacterium]